MVLLKGQLLAIGKPVGKFDGTFDGMVESVKCSSAKDSGETLCSVEGMFQG